jgi:hypothetical protein
MIILLYIALIFVIIGYLGTVLIAWQSIAKRDHVTYISLIFILLGAAGAIWITIDTSRTTDKLVISSGLLANSQTELRKKADEQTESQQLLRKKSDEIALLNREIANNQRKLSEKSDDISNLNKTIAATVTGGESFCFLSPDPAFGKINTIDFYLMTHGKYPLYDVFIRIWDDNCLEGFDSGKIVETQEEWSKTENKIIEHMRQCLIHQEKVGTFSPKNDVNIMDSPLISCTIPKGIDLDKYSQKYTVDISARNGHYVQNITITVRNKKYYHIYSKVEKILSDSKREIIREYESVDSGGFVINIIK